MRRATGRPRMTRFSFKHQSKRGSVFCGVKNALRVASLLTVILCVFFWISSVGHIYSKPDTHLDEVRDTALHRLFGQHGEEIQGAVHDNWHWFRTYLAKLRHSSRAAVSSSLGEEDEEDKVEPQKLILGKDKSVGLSTDSEEEVATATEVGTASVRPGGGGVPAVASKQGRLVRAADDQGPLNNLDMPMKKIHGKLQPCLALLPVSEIEQLKFPPEKPEASPKLKYYQLDEEAREIEETGGAVDKGRSLALDMFAGKQTMGERAESFKVQKSMEVHCGFAAGDTGFDISPKDEEYLKGCKAAVVTAAFGGGDTLAQPLGMTKASLDKVCYVAFWDDITLITQEAAGMVVDPATGHVGIWRVVLVKNLPFVDQRRNGKIPKILTHRLFPKAKYSIWVDSKYQFRRDPMGVLEALLWRKGAVFAISEHGARNCIYAEGEAIVRKHKASPEEVAIQLNQYRAEGLPLNATLNGKKALAEASVIIREHNSVTNLFMCLWFNEMVRFTSRDQLSFGYVLRRLNLLKPYMFPVCTRRALVNKLGHVRKAKPLVRTFSR